jgi:hypothetical protein
MPGLRPILVDRRFGTLTAHILNQFGSDDVTLIHRREPCVRSTLQ